MKYTKQITGKKVYLSPVLEDDAILWAEWYNDIYISMPESNVYDVITEENTIAMAKDIIENQYNVFTVVDLEHNKAIGKIELEVNPGSISGSFGILIGNKDYWGNGYGKEATELILDYAFNTLKIHNMMLGVYAFNKRAYSLYQYIGFKDIGVKREYQLIAGKRYDMIFMDMLSTEFKGL